MLAADGRPRRRPSGSGSGGKAGLSFPLPRQVHDRGVLFAGRGLGDGTERMQPGEENEPASATWHRDANPAYRLAFGVGLLVFAGSFLAGLGEAIRVLGAPPVAVDATALGRALVAQGDYSRAFGEFRLAGMIDPVGYPSPPELAYPAPSHPNAAGLLAQAGRAARQRPGDAAAHLQLGRALMLPGAYADSVRSLERALDLDPELPRLHASLGRAQLLAGSALPAERAFREALTRESRQPALHDDLGFALYQLGRLEEAAEAFERGRELREKQTRAPGAGS